MVEKIEIQKIFHPVSSSARVKKVKRQNGNMQHNRFSRQLHEEEEEGKKRKEERRIPGGSEMISVQEEGSDFRESREKEPEKILGKDDSDDSMSGKIVDILV